MKLNENFAHRSKIEVLILKIKTKLEGPGPKMYVSLESELGAAPVPALGVVADGVVSAHADPIRK